MIGFLFLVVVVGAVLYFVNKYVEMAPAFKGAVNIIAVLILLWYALQLFGLVGGHGPAKL